MGTIIRFFLSILVAIGSVPSFCQVIDATTCDSTTRFPVTQFSYYLQTTQPISIDSAIKSQSKFVRANNEPVLVFNYDPYYYWFRIIIKNPQYNSRQLMMVLPFLGMYEGLLFQKINGKWSQVAHTGLKYKFQDRSYQFTHYVFPFTLQPQHTDTLYVSIDASNAYKTFGFALIKPKELKIFENKIYFVFGIIVGLLILFFVLNVSLFFALKEKLHLWYSLYIALLFLIVMKNDLLDQEFLGLDSERAYRLTPYMTVGALAIAVLMHVVQGFLRDTLIHNKQLFRLAEFLKVNVLCSAVVHTFVFLMVSNYHIQTLVFNWAKISVLLGICIVIINCIYCVTKGFTSALFLFSGSFIFLIGSIQRLFISSSLTFLFPPTIFQIGIMVETFVITLGLIYRYWSEKALQRQKEDQIQTQTMKDISEEIHDNVGQTLTLANLNLKTIDFNNEKSIHSKINDSKMLISKAIFDLRDLIRTLRNESAAETDIIEQIKTECLNVEKTGVFKIDFDIKGEVVDLENKKQAILIRIIKEVLQNAIKHSQASKVDVSLNFQPSMLSIEIRDDGIGYDLAIANLNGNGLKNIKNRCLLLNATCHFESRIGRGFEISIRMPIYESPPVYNQKKQDFQQL